MYTNQMGDSPYSVRSHAKLDLWTKSFKPLGGSITPQTSIWPESTSTNPSWALGSRVMAKGGMGRVPPNLRWWFETTSRSFDTLEGKTCALNPMQTPISCDMLRPFDATWWQHCFVLNKNSHPCKSFCLHTYNHTNSNDIWETKDTIVRHEFSRRAGRTLWWYL